MGLSSVSEAAADTFAGGMEPTYFFIGGGEARRKTKKMPKTQIRQLMPTRKTIDFFGMKHLFLYLRGVVRNRPP